MAASKEWYNEWCRRRYAERKAEAIQILGGKCARCAETENLEIDHINRSTKTMYFEKMATTTRAKFLAELALCQLLCKPHHVMKTAEERGQPYMQHGTISMYKRGCRCEACSPFKPRWNKKYNRAWRRAKKALRQGLPLNTGV